MKDEEDRFKTKCTKLSNVILASRPSFDLIQ